MRQQCGRKSLGLQQAGAAQAQLTVDDRRVVEDEVALALGGAVMVDQRDRRLDQPLGQLLRVCQRRRGAKEVRVAAVEAADALQAAQHVGHVAAEDAAVGVQLVQHHVAQAAQQFGPLRMVGQDAGVQHVGIRQDGTCLASDAAALALRGVAVVGGGPQRIDN